MKSVAKGGKKKKKKKHHEITLSNGEGERRKREVDLVDLLSKEKTPPYPEKGTFPSAKK